MVYFAVEHINLGTYFFSSEIRRDSLHLFLRKTQNKSGKVYFNFILILFPHGTVLVGNYHKTKN